jgi:hypothetical protein
METINKLRANVQTIETAEAAHYQAQSQNDAAENTRLSNNGGGAHVPSLAGITTTIPIRSKKPDAHIDLAAG